MILNVSQKEDQVLFPDVLLHAYSDISFNTIEQAKETIIQYIDGTLLYRKIQNTMQGIIQICTLAGYLT